MEVFRNLPRAAYATLAAAMLASCAEYGDPAYRPDFTVVGRVTATRLISVMFGDVELRNHLYTLEYQLGPGRQRSLYFIVRTAVTGCPDEFPPNQLYRVVLHRETIFYMMHLDEPEENKTNWADLRALKCDPVAIGN